MVKELKMWLTPLKGVVFNFKGVCDTIGLPHSTLTDFVSERAYISKNAFPKVLSFFLGHGFKLYANQTGSEVVGDTLIVCTRETVSESEVVEVEQHLSILEAWEVYENERKGFKSEKTQPKKRRIVKM